MLKKILILPTLLLCVLNVFSQDPEARLKELNIVLPAIGKPIANYVHVARSGNLLFLAGKGPSDAQGNYLKGK